MVSVLSKLRAVICILWHLPALCLLLFEYLFSSAWIEFLANCKSASMQEPVWILKVPKVDLFFVHFKKLAQNAVWEIRIWSLSSWKINAIFHFSLFVYCLYVSKAFNYKNDPFVAETGESGVSEPDWLQPLDRYMCECSGEEPAPPQ